MFRLSHIRWTASLLAIALVGCSLRSAGVRGPKPAESQVTVNPAGEKFDPAKLSQKSPLSPEASVAMPAATSPVPSSAYPLSRTSIASRMRNAAAAAREAVTIKPREIPADDPIALRTKPGPVGPMVYLSAAKVYENQGKEAEAIEQYQKALKSEPTNHDAMIGLARLHHRAGRLDQATALYQDALQDHPNSAIVSNDLALCYARRGMHANSIETMKRAVQLAPASKRYRNNLARILVDNSQYDAALTQLTAAHGEAIGHYNLGYMLHEKGLSDQALPHFAKAAQYDHNLTAARQMVAKLQPQPQPRPQAIVRSQPENNVRETPVSYRDAEAIRLPVATERYPASTSVNLTIGDTVASPSASRTNSHSPAITGAELRRMPATDNGSQAAPTPGTAPSYLRGGNN